MGPEDIRQHQRRKPFQPFRIHMSDGGTYDVFHPDMLMIGTREVVVATQYRDGIVQEKTFCSIRHITRIELPDSAAAA